jgi:hypothetical protein
VPAFEALQFLQLEAAGKTHEADKLLDLQANLAQFRGRPAFVRGRKPTSLSDEEYATVRALGALISFELVTCNGDRAEIRIIRPDVLRLFPNRTDGVSLTTPRDAAEREQWLRLLRDRYKELSKIPTIVETYPLPLIKTDHGVKVGIGG